MNNNYYDYIYDLPVDKHKKQNEVEIELLRTLFQKNKPFFSIVLKESYESFFVALLFLIFTIPYTENIIKSIFPVTENLSVLLIVIKFISVMIAYWMMKHFLF
jgi:hypothetical protein